MKYIMETLPYCVHFVFTSMCLILQCHHLRLRLYGILQCHTHTHTVIWSRSYAASLFTIIFVHTLGSMFRLIHIFNLLHAPSHSVVCYVVYPLSLCPSPYILNVQVLRFIKTFLKINSTSGVENYVESVQKCVLFVYAWSRIQVRLFGSHCILAAPLSPTYRIYSYILLAIGFYRLLRDCIWNRKWNKI